MANDETGPGARPGGAKARVVALTALGTLVGCVGYAGQQGYLAATDSFVAPIILSPDSDQVVASKLHGSQLTVERTRTASEIESVEEALAAGQKALSRLKAVQSAPGSAMAWTSNRSDRQVTLGLSEQKMLKEQRAVLADMASKQAKLVREGKDNLAAGLISQAEYTKELQIESELRIAMIENDRTRLQSNMEMSEAALARKSLSGQAPTMPEMAAREEQMVRVELEVMKLESEQRSKRAEKKLLVDKLAMLDEMDAKLRSRPVFRATEKRMDVAFVPYTQSAGVRPGATVYECVWGVFHCAAVGQVAEVVPGEVSLPDPWGNQARGHYAVLTLHHQDAAKARTLRVRGGRAEPAPPPSDNADWVSAR